MGAAWRFPTVVESASGPAPAARSSSSMTWAEYGAFEGGGGGGRDDDGRIEKRASEREKRNPVRPEKPQRSPLSLFSSPLKNNTKQHRRDALHLLAAGLRRSRCGQREIEPKENRRRQSEENEEREKTFLKTIEEKKKKPKLKTEKKSLFYQATSPPCPLAASPSSTPRRAP